MYIASWCQGKTMVQTSTTRGFKKRNDAADQGLYRQVQVGSKVEIKHARMSKHLEAKEVNSASSGITRRGKTRIVEMQNVKQD